MLSELLKYAQDNGISATPGFKAKPISAYILLSSTGEFLGVRSLDKGTEVYAPDVGSFINSSTGCNFLIEKASIVALIPTGEVDKDQNAPARRCTFLKLLDDGASAEPLFRVVATTLKNEETTAQIKQAITENKISPSAQIGFQIDGIPLESTFSYRAWWADYRKTLLEKSRAKKNQQNGEQTENSKARCLATGDIVEPVRIAGTIKGLISVGGRKLGGGDALICFNEESEAFESYHFKNAQNAPVGETSIVAINTALEDLIKKAPAVAGAKILHWYSTPISGSECPVKLFFDGTYEQNENSSQDDEISSMQKAKRILSSIHAGQRPDLAKAKFYIMPISGMSGRIMVREWEEGSFETLQKNIIAWFDDLAIISPSGNGTTKPPKYKALLYCLLPRKLIDNKAGNISKKGKDTNNSKKEEKRQNLASRLLDSALNNRPIPDEVAVRCLQYIRSEIHPDKEENQQSQNNYYSGKLGETSVPFQILKAWYIRANLSKEKSKMNEEGMTVPSAAYNCGRLLATYGMLQETAMPQNNVGVVEKFYASASTTPNLVIGRIQSMATHHMAKLSKEASEFFEDELCAVYSQIDAHQIPRMLNFKEQTEFALGFYQQRAKLKAELETMKGKEDKE